MTDRRHRTRSATAACGVLLGLALAAAGCASTGSPGAAPTRAAAAVVDFPELTAGVEAGIAQGRYPGAVYAVSRGEEVLTLQAAGVADIGDGKQMTTDAVFRLMSMTKPVTAVAVMILVEEGRLDLDAPVGRYLPAFEGFGAEGALVTLRHLLTHTSGIGFGSLPSGQTTLEARATTASARTLRVRPGSQWAYSGVEGPDVLARVVEVVAGEPFDRFVQNRIFSPLGMTDTGWTLSEAQRARLVGLYDARDGVIAEANPFLADATYPSGGFGLFSTAPDMMRFVRMLANEGELDGRRILSTQSVRTLHTSQLPAGLPGLGAGLGSGLLMRIVLDPAAAGSPLPAGAYGWSGAYGTHFWVDPETGLAAVWMINLNNAGGAGSPDALAFEELVVKACLAQPRCRN